MRNTSSTDHIAFDAIGIPAFQFHQDRMDYGNLTHHSNMDAYGHIRPDDLKQAVTIMAGFVYDAAKCDEMITRKPIRPDDPPAKTDSAIGSEKSGPQSKWPSPTEGAALHKANQVRYKNMKSPPGIADNGTRALSVRSLRI
jgi:hypothetical protein